MKLSTTSALTSASLLALTSAQSAITCKSGAHVIVARASNEPAGFGILKRVADNITAQIPDSDSIAVPYPAKITNPAYGDSVIQGVSNMTQLVKSYGEKCPDGKMVLLGYSQGAQVVGDTLIGGDYSQFKNLDQGPGVEQKLIDQVAAVVLMGDPVNIAGEKFLVGNSTHNGTFPRDNAADWVKTGLAGRLRSYCDANDTYCDSGKSLAVHLSYVQVYGKEAVKFVVEKFNAAGGNGSSNGSAQATGTATAGGADVSSTSGVVRVASTPPPVAAAASINSGAMSYVMTAVLGSALVITLSL
ncbi:MAG: hypothetical protein MMC23_008266 [Stictis urceolatum]|nr:hypothetical protein [Stictis urceolata]